MIDTTNFIEFYKVSEDGQIERVKDNVISKTPYTVPTASESVDMWYCFNNNRQEKEVFGGTETALLDKEATTGYRSAVMRLSYLGQARCDVQEAAKCFAQRMKSPNEYDWE